jgi:O-antigen/teichoic acid export membrane protein
VLYSAQGAADAVLTGFERLDITSAARVVYQMVFVILGAVALWLGAGYFGLIYANLAGIAIMTLICVGGARSLGVRPTGAQPGQWPTLLRASVPFGVIGFTLGLSYRFDSVLLNLTRGDVETGYYNAVYNLVFSMVLLSNVVNSALYPSLARQRRSAPHTLPAIYERALRYLLMLALPIAVGASVLADRIVPFLFTEAYAPASPALRIVIWVVPLMYLSEFLGDVVVVARYGVVAAAATTVLTELVLAGQYLWMLRGDLAAVRWGHVLGRPLLAALLMGALELALPPLPLPISVATGAIAYLVALLALGVIGPDEWRFVRELRRPAEVAP